MTRAEAREFLLSIANQLGYIGVEDLTDRDGKRMIEAIKALEEPQWIPCSDCERGCEKWEHSKTLQE